MPLQIHCPCDTDHIDFHAFMQFFRTLKKLESLVAKEIQSGLGEGYAFSNPKVAKIGDISEYSPNAFLTYF